VVGVSDLSKHIFANTYKITERNVIAHIPLCIVLYLLYTVNHQMKRNAIPGLCVPVYTIASGETHFASVNILL